MTRPRKELVCVQDTPYYHIVSRCVRRAFLCGVDERTQTSYEHRRQWIVDRLRILASVFSIDLCAYAVMSNHYHLVVKLDPKAAEQWSTREVIQRWCTLFKGPPLIQKLHRRDDLAPAEYDTVSAIATAWRARLSDLGWFMKCLNEPIARAANQEDGCTGHFWEARYRSQALLSERALLACMAYVDLNPIRAKMAHTPEASDFTSIQERIRPQFDLQEAVRQALSDADDSVEEQHAAIGSPAIPLKPLLHFSGSECQEPQSGLPFSLNDYLTLVDMTGRCIREDKRGYIPHTLPPILERVTLDVDTWLQHSTQFEQRFQRHFNHRKKVA